MTEFNSVASSQNYVIHMTWFVHVYVFHPHQNSKNIPQNSTGFILLIFKINFFPVFSCCDIHLFKLIYNCFATLD